MEVQAEAETKGEGEAKVRATIQEGDSKVRTVRLYTSSNLLQDQGDVQLDMMEAERDSAEMVLRAKGAVGKARKKTKTSK